MIFGDAIPLPMLMSIWTLLDDCILILELVKDILKKGALSEGLLLISRYLTEFSQVFGTYHLEWKKYIHGLQQDEINLEWKKYIYELRKEEVAMRCEKEGTELKWRRDTVEEELDQSSQGNEFSLIYKVSSY